MPDHGTVRFWNSVAQTFKGMSGHVIFDLFNEPFPDSNAIDTTAAWTCWRDGGAACPHLDYNATGLQRLVSEVRSTNAANIIILGGINYANSLDQWLDYKPVDPLEKLAASWHSYSTNFCNNLACWVSSIEPTMNVVPVIAGEIGELDCRGEYISPLMDWLDSKQTSYLAWIFLPWNCETGPALITDLDGT